MNHPAPPIDGNVHILGQRERRALMIGLDLETTDSDPSRAQVVQLAAVSRCPGYLPPEGDGGSFLLDPGVPIPPGATAVHKLTDADVRGKPTLQESLPQVVALLRSAAQPGALLVGYNVRRYDLALLQCRLAELGVVAPTPTIVDVFDLACWHLRHLPSLKLSAVAEHLGVPFAEGQAHDALHDVRKTFEVLDRLRTVLGLGDDFAGDVELIRQSALAAVRCDVERDRYGHYAYRCRQRWSEPDAPFRLGMGKHRGKLLAELREQEPSYCDWFVGGPLRQAPQGVWDELRRAGWRLPARGAQ